MTGNHVHVSGWEVRAARAVWAHKGWLALAVLAAAAGLLVWAASASGIALPSASVQPDGPTLSIAQDSPGEAFGFSLLDPINDWLAGILRDVCNSLLYFEAMVLSNIATGSDLAKAFTELIPSAMPVIEQVHWSVSVPLANLVLLIFLVTGLVRTVSRMSATGGGVDVWQLMVVFVVYAFMKTVIDSSWYLMALTYEVLMDFLPAIRSTALPAASFTPLPDDFTDLASLLLTLIVALVVLLIVGACYLVCLTTVMVRSIQIYAYTAFGAIPLASAVSEGSRHVATSFVRKYVALVFTGLLLALLFAMMAGTVNFVGAVATVPTASDPASIPKYAMELMASPVLLIAYTFCIVRTGDWARDLMGL